MDEASDFFIDALVLAELDFAVMHDTELLFTSDKLLIDLFSVELTDIVAVVCNLPVALALEQLIPLEPKALDDSALNVLLDWAANLLGSMETKLLCASDFIVMCVVETDSLGCLTIGDGLGFIPTNLSVLEVEIFDVETNELFDDCAKWDSFQSAEEPGSLVVMGIFFWDK